MALHLVSEDSASLGRFSNPPAFRKPLTNWHSFFPSMLSRETITCWHAGTSHPTPFFARRPRTRSAPRLCPRFSRRRAGHTSTRSSSSPTPERPLKRCRACSAMTTGSSAPRLWKDQRLTECMNCILEENIFRHRFRLYEWCWGEVPESCATV